MRRTTALTTPPSDSKGRIRRRLFHSPSKTRQTRTNLVVTAFTVVAVVLLVGVHLFLYFQVVMSQSGNERQAFGKPGNIAKAQSKSAEEIALRGTKTTMQDRSLTPLRDMDRELYTIRINTWKRLEQLMVSVDHHASCPGVSQIQIVWCDPEEPPQELFDHAKVVVERHETNSLNERFHILSPAPTLGILSIDDDVLRPCEAIDAGFFKWTLHPDRMIGFDARIHVENDGGTWKVGKRRDFFLFWWRRLSVLTLALIFTTHGLWICAVWIHEVNSSTGYYIFSITRTSLTSFLSCLQHNGKGESVQSVASTILFLASRLFGLVHVSSETHIRQGVQGV
jgi:hypothetical protein